MTHHCLPPGTLLGGNYQIIKRIGEGGMGAVYMAYDNRLDLQVAVKALSPAMSGDGEDGPEGALERFATEAKIAAAIDHPNVIRIYGFHRDRLETNGQAREVDYLVMELLAGRNLRHTMDVSGFEHEEQIAAWIVRYLIPILDGLQKVHECGIIHRDLKPENFLMKDDTPKMADFGLSLGFNFPAVTGSIADIFGTVPYMAPEQFYNFSMARETADVYAIGKILYEIVEGKISEKVKPFKQARLSHPETDFLRNLDRIIRDATEENPDKRIGSAEELKERLLELIYCRKKPQLERRNGQRPSGLHRKPVLLAVLLLSLAVGAWSMHMAHNSRRLQAAPALGDQRAARPEMDFKPLVAPGWRQIQRSDDNSVLRLVIPSEPDAAAESAQTDIAPFYMSESPITNQQYVMFLNEVADRATVRGDDVFIDGRLAITISEKIRGYKPIARDGNGFRMKDPMHSACAVLLVTGFGAEAYARHYGLRLPDGREWAYVVVNGESPAEPAMPVPMPVINYPPDAFGLRGINKVAEWGKTGSGDLVVLGPSPSGMGEERYFHQELPGNYFTDTSFRVAKDAG